MTEKYYLITSKFNSLNAATVLRFEGKKITDLQKNNDIKFNESIPDDWINISKNEAFHLVKIDINARIDYYEGNIFNSIKNLNQEDKCYYIKDRKRSLCTVVRKTEKTDGLYFMIKLEDGKNVMVPSYDIELLYNKRLPREAYMSKTNAVLESNDVSGNGCNNDTGSNSQGESSNIDRMNQESHSPSHSDNQSCSVEGRDNHFDNKGNYADASHKHENAGNYSSVSMNVNTPNNDSENIPSLDVSTRQQGIDNGGGSKSTQSHVLDNRKITEINQHLSPINTQNKRPYNVVTGQCRKDSYITKGQKSNEVHGGATRSDNRNIEDSQRHFAKQHDSRNTHNVNYGPDKSMHSNALSNNYNNKHNKTNDTRLTNAKKDTRGRENDTSTESSSSNRVCNGNTKLIWCDQIKLYIHNPDYIEKIVAHQKIHKYIVYRYKGTTLSVAAEWIGLVDESPSVGCVLYFDYEMATNGWFKGRYYFDCPAHRGVLVCPEEFCISDKIHKDLKFTDELSITEDSVCCITYPKQSPKIPMKREIIFKIGNSKKLVKCMWFGQINGKDTVGLDIEALQGSGTCGTFCSVKLFQSDNKCGFLYEYGNITYIPRTEYFREIYLMKDYDLTSIVKETNIDIMGKLIIVKDDPIIYGRARFCMTFLGEYLIGIELDEFNLQNNVSLLEALYYDTIIQGKYAVIVKIDYIVTANESLLYNPDNGVVDVSSVKVTEGYISDRFKVDATVIYGNGEIGNIIEFHLLNDVPCVNVRQLKNNIAMYIREDAVRNFEPNDMFKKTVAPLSNNLCLDSSKRSNTDLLEINDLHNSMEQSCSEELPIDDIVSHKDQIFKKNDIVQFNCQDRRRHGRIEKIEYRKNNKKAGVIDYIRYEGDNRLHYIDIAELTRVEVNEGLTSYFEDVIVDPRSIATLEQSSDNDINVGDDIEFPLKDSKVSINGCVRGILKVNDCQSVLVELSEDRGDVDIAHYKINGLKCPTNAFKFTNTAVIVKRSLVKKIIVHNTVNNILAENNEHVTHVGPSENMDKTIMFKRNGQTTTARLRWVGQVNNEMCIGCEMRDKVEGGAYGMFGDTRLFECAEGRGALIPLKSVEECCVNGSHRKPRRYPDGRINGPSICCVERSQNNSELKLEDRVMKKDANGRLFGICRWIGLINGIDVIGMEMVQCKKIVPDQCIQTLDLFRCPPNKAGLFVSEEIIPDPIGLCSCAKNNIPCVDVSNIKSVEDAELTKKLVIYEDSKKTVVIDIRWKGLVNGIKCIACQMEAECDCGMNGRFLGERWFDCEEAKGFLVPESYINKSCEYTGNHKEPIKYAYGGVNPDSICCVESLYKIDTRPTMRIGSKLKYRQNFPGTKKIGDCMWMGLVNGVKVIGTNMKEEMSFSVKGVFSLSKLFKCNGGQEVIFMSDDVEHDIDGKTLNFLADKIVDINNLCNVTVLNQSNVDQRKIGDYVSICIDGKESKGQLKWIGAIDGVECAGIDLEYQCKYGMNGIINDTCNFQCLPRHGVVTTADNVKPNKGPLHPTFKSNGTIDANTYLICEATSSQEYLREKNVDKNGFVKVQINTDDGKVNWKGVLRWHGTMNRTPVAVVELDQDYDGGTDGRFWRHQLIKCSNKRAIAVTWNSVFQYIQFKPMEIPCDKRLFTEINLNSAVVLYERKGNELNEQYGTVKWSGINDDGKYFYGIELDNRNSNGTNGTFDGQRLFQCANGYGVLEPMLEVAPDTRFTESVVPEDEITKSEVSEVCQYSIPVKRYRGENKGIQGNANSCYFDSSIFALFAKSDVLDFLISPMINGSEAENEITKEFRDIIAYRIIYPLRQFGFVTFHRTNEMRDTIRRYGAKFEEMTRHETDMENVGALLANLCPEEQLLSLTTFVNTRKLVKNKCMFMQLFVTLDQRVPYISSQQMLDTSMAQNDIMFDKPPTCLIMQAPRDAKGINCYNRALPSRIIEISKLCFDSFKKCRECDSAAKWQCKKCLESTLHIKDALSCDDHKCTHDEVVTIPDTTHNSRSEVQMTIKAIICIARAHFVAYVKEDEISNEWIFFDSMSTQSNSNNYSVPKVSVETIVTDFLAQDEESMKQWLENDIPHELQRVVKDSYIFVYHNPALTCY